MYFLTFSKSRYDLQAKQTVLLIWLMAHLGFPSWEQTLGGPYCFPLYNPTTKLSPFRLLILIFTRIYFYFLCKCKSRTEVRSCKNRAVSVTPHACFRRFLCDTSQMSHASSEKQCFLIPIGLVKMPAFRTVVKRHTAPIVKTRGRGGN